MKTLQQTNKLTTFIATKLETAQYLTSRHISYTYVH